VSPARPSAVTLLVSKLTESPHSIIIFVMGLTMLRIDRSKLKWKLKLQGAFDKKEHAELDEKDKKEGKGSKWTLFLLPFVTVLREGLEAVVFIGGVSLGQSAKSIPLAAITGLICGLIVGCEYAVKSFYTSIDIPDSSRPDLRLWLAR